jgi:hypothetical protein
MFKLARFPAEKGEATAELDMRFLEACVDQSGASAIRTRNMRFFIKNVKGCNFEDIDINTM